MRAALRTAVQQDTQIDAPVLEMLRKWLGEDDEALQLGFWSWLMLSPGCEGMIGIAF